MWAKTYLQIGAISVAVPFLDSCSSVDHIDIMELVQLRSAKIEQAEFGSQLTPVSHAAWMRPWEGLLPLPNRWNFGSITKPEWEDLDIKRDTAVSPSAPQMAQTIIITNPKRDEFHMSEADFNSMLIHCHANIFFKELLVTYFTQWESAAMWHYLTCPVNLSEDARATWAKGQFVPFWAERWESIKLSTIFGAMIDKTVEHRDFFEECKLLTRRARREDLRYGNPYWLLEDYIEHVDTWVLLGYSRDDMHDMFDAMDDDHGVMTMLATLSERDPRLVAFEEVLWQANSMVWNPANMYEVQAAHMFLERYIPEFWKDEQVKQTCLEMLRTQNFSWPLPWGTKEAVIDCATGLLNENWEPPEYPETIYPEPKENGRNNQFDKHRREQIQRLMHYGVIQIG